LRYGGPWGQAFPEPLFDNVFEVDSWRRVAEKHLRLALRATGSAVRVDAIAFNTEFVPPPRVRALYRLDVDDWNGRERLQLIVQHLEPA
jgi:single-stranded-DNA-specific exonuclease